MAPKIAHPINVPIYEEAAEWLVKNREHALDESARRSFDLWLRISPEHIRAYLELSALWEDLSFLGSDATAALSEPIAPLGIESNVVPLHPTQARATVSDRALADSASVVQRDTTTRRPSWRFGIAASLLIFVLAAGVLTWTTRDPSYATALGEQRTIKLTDGSTVELNSASRVLIHFTKQQRSVELVRGQALFQVAKDRTRPFIVSAGTARVRAVGTQFDVYQKRAATVVTVLEGQVAILPQRELTEIAPQRQQPSSNRAREPSRATTGVDPDPKRASPILLSAGQQLTVTRDEVAAPTRADVAAATAWTQHHIVFTDAPLNEVVEEFNRYNTRRLVIATPELESFRINGVFSSADPAVLLRFLRQQNDIDVEETDTTIRISHR